MLKVKVINEISEIKVEFDYYIPFKLIYYNSEKNMQQKKYYNLGDNKYSLLEIGVNSLSHKINSIALIAIKKEKIATKNFDLNINEICNGTPICLIEYNNQYPEDIISDLKLYLDYDSLYLQIDRLIPVKHIQNKRVFIGLDCDSKIASICIKDITCDEMKMLKGSLLIKE